VLIFPELSLAGYEPELAFSTKYMRLQSLRTLAAQNAMSIVVGTPLVNPAGKPHLGVIIFTDMGKVQTYAKIHLGGDEPAWFTPGETPLLLQSAGHSIGLAICADSSRPTHPRHYAESGAGIYASGVFLTEEWYTGDVPRLHEYAARHCMLVVMANHGASVGTRQSVGRSRIWGPDGEVLAEAAGTRSSLLVTKMVGGGWRGGELPLS